MDLRKIGLLERTMLNELGNKQLKRAYTDLALKLDKYYRPERNRTVFEHEIYKRLRKATRLQIFRSIWIGKRNIDLFIPAVSFNDVETRHGFNGLAIEVDGSIHDEYSKMMKDQSKYSNLHQLYILLCVIENQDIKHPTVENLINKIATLKRLDSRAKKRLFRNIYILTISANRKFIEDHGINSCFPFLGIFKGN